MSLKGKPTIIKFEGENEKQEFLNWAFGKGKPSEGVSKAKRAMRLVQKSTEFDFNYNEMTAQEELKFLKESPPNESYTSEELKNTLSRPTYQKSNKANNTRY